MMTELQISNTDGITRAVLQGRLDSGAVDRIELNFTAGIVPVGKPAVVDLTDVTFLASLGIRMLLSTARALDRRGAKLALFGASPAVMEIIETVALTEIVPVLGTESEAIALVTA
jgi:anti-sigma B factor antagonist